MEFRISFHEVVNQSPRKLTLRDMHAWIPWNRYDGLREKL